MSTLEDFVKKEKRFLYAAGTFVGTRFLDYISTVIALSKAQEYAEMLKTGIVQMPEDPFYEFFGNVERNVSNTERNPLARFFIQEYGLGAGLFLHTLMLVPAAVGLAYFLNKIDLKPIVKPKPGNIILYSVSGFSLLAATWNIFYFAILDHALLGN